MWLIILTIMSFRADIESIKDKFLSLKGERKIIITTEKDAVRLAYNPYFPATVKPSTFFMPISVKMMAGIEGNDLIGDVIDGIGK